ncbi:DUF1310 family protein [Lactococcus garvieae]|nr:DUF1310 family protein [Lactococcus garvieae]
MKKNALVSMGILLAAILLIILGIGGKFYMDKKQFHNEMIRVVKSDEAKKVYVDTLEQADPKALTPEGIIKSYEVDYKSVEHNPMGGIMLKLIINNDDKLYIRVTLEKENNGTLSNSSGGGSVDMEELLQKGDNNA